MGPLLTIVYSMSEDKTNPKYLNNPKGHLQALIAFRDRVQERMLGEEDKEWRGELQFVLDRTLVKIREVKRKLV